MSAIQHRLGGEIKMFSTLHEALTTRPFDKLSFDLDDGRLILRSDGVWEFWDEHGQWTATGLEPWLKSP